MRKSLQHQSSSVFEDDDILSKMGKRKSSRVGKKELDIYENDKKLSKTKD